jgi:tetratricopeptide (TPR) repeat protein
LRHWAHLAHLPWSWKPVDQSAEKESALLTRYPYPSPFADSLVSMGHFIYTKKMFVPILIAVVFLIAGSTAVILHLNKPKNKKTGLFASRKKDNKTPENDEARVMAALKKLEKDPSDTAALLTLGEKYYQQQDWDKTYKTYRILCETPSGQKDIDYFEMNFRYGQAAAKLGLLGEARKNLIVAASFKESDYRVQYELGNLNFLNRNYERAVAYLTKARSLNPEHAPTLCVLGHTYFKLKKFKEAMVNIRKALDIMPGDKETLFTLAECYEESGQTDQAVRIYSHLRADPEWGPASCLAAGNIHAAAQRLNEAITDYEIGLKHNKIKSAVALELHYRLGTTYLKLNDVTNALAHLKTISQEKPDYKNTDRLINQYAEVYANQNLQTYIMSPSDEFLGLCRKIVLSFYSKAKVKIVQTNVTDRDWADILAQIDTPRWSHLIGFRFFRTQGVIGELVVRDFHEHLKNVKADKGLCFGAGQFSDEARHFTEVRLIELIERSRLIAILASLTQPTPNNAERSL